MGKDAYTPKQRKAAERAYRSGGAQPQVVISRKYKRQKPVQSGLWAALTGGMSLPFSAWRASRRAAYNRRTRKISAW